MSGRSGEVQAKIKAVYPNTHYIHCYTHQLNLIMEKAASQNHGTRVFFCSLSAFPAFFSYSAQRLSALDAVVARRIPSVSAIRWNFKSRSVNMVYEYQDSLIDCFAELENSLSSNGPRRSLSYFGRQRFSFLAEVFSQNNASCRHSV